MSKVEIHKCDECDKTIELRADRWSRHDDGQYVRPPHDWLRVNLSSMYQDKMGEMVNVSAELCSVACARKKLEKAIARLDEFEKWSAAEELREKHLAELREKERKAEWEKRQREADARGPGFRG